jgi:predicted CopG family antitoxin
MESCFVAGGDVKAALKKDVELLKRVKEFAGHEFLVDKGNTEFALTFSRLKAMTSSLRKISEKDMLFLHSEIENLSDMIKEILENKVPNLYALTFFMMTKSESQLKDLPYEEKMKKVERNYNQGFRKSMEDVLLRAMERANANTPILSGNGDKTKEERIEYIMGEWIWRYL